MFLTISNPQSLTKKSPKYDTIEREGERERERVDRRFSKMANNHFVYKDVDGALTQWDDIQRKLGNLPPKPLAFMPPSFKPAEDEDSKHKDKAHHRDCDYHRRLLLSVYTFYSKGVCS
ncbi:unnamed protein product [Camellia sinensis]